VPRADAGDAGLQNGAPLRLHGLIVLLCVCVVLRLASLPQSVIPSRSL
jgi:hypothetical protein